MAPSRRLVLGLGNPLAGSDAFGSAVVARLRAHGAASAATTLADAGTDLLGHIETFLAYDDVVLVDAVVGLARPGDVAAFDEEAFTAWPEAAASAHHMSPLAAVKLFRTLYPHATTKIRLVGYSAGEIVMRTSLPEDAVEKGVAAVMRLLADAPAAGNTIMR